MGIDGFESLDRVFEELYEDRRSGDACSVGMEGAALVRGVNALCGEEAWIALVSRVKEEGVAFLAD